MIPIERRSIQLTPAEVRTVRQLFEAHAPELARAADTGMQAAEVHQPFFRRHRIIEIGLVQTFPAREAHVALSDPRSGRLLTGRLDELNDMVALDPPPRIADEGIARIYGNVADYWTTGAGYYGELLIQSFDDIPFSDGLLEVEQHMVDALREMLGEHIEGLRVDPTDGGFTLTSWLVTRCQLIRRELGVQITGHLSRTDQVYDSELPVPEGRFWAMVGGRLVPVG